MFRVVSRRLGARGGSGARGKEVSLHNFAQHFTDHNAAVDRASVPAAAPRYNSGGFHCSQSLTLRTAHQSNPGDTTPISHCLHAPLLCCMVTNTNRAGTLTEVERWLKKSGSIWKRLVLCRLDTLFWSQCCSNCPGFRLCNALPMTNPLSAGADYTVTLLASRPAKSIGQFSSRWTAEDGWYGYLPARPSNPSHPATTARKQFGSHLITLCWSPDVSLPH